MGATRKGRNKARRERRKARREADDKANRAIMKTMDRLGLKSGLTVMMDDLTDAIRYATASIPWYMND